MLEYTLTVFAKGSALPIGSVSLPSATEAMAAIPKLLADHPGCERIRVQAGATYLFSVDCKGERIPD